MTGTETRALAVAAVVLVVAGTARTVTLGRRADPVFPPDSSGGVTRVLLESRRQAGRKARRETPLGPGERIDPNRAPADELDRIPGVGPALARAIVEERSRGGPFQRFEDLDRVRGVGPASLARLIPYLEVNGRRAATTSSRQTGHASPSLAGSARPSTGPLDLNRASADELSRLPGIGPTLAARIVEARKRRVAFRSVDDLLSVPGIGPATLARVRSGVVVRR